MKFKKIKSTNREASSAHFFRLSTRSRRGIEPFLAPRLGNKKLLTFCFSRLTSPIKLTIIFTALLFSLAGPSVIETSLAGPSEEVLKGFSKTATEAGYDVESQDTGKPKKEFVEVLATYGYGFASGVGGIIFMIFIIYGGWLWMTAQGKEEQVEKAKKIIIGATIGLGIIIGARIIAELIIQYLGAAIEVPAT